ncbi:cell growth regulator with RING finger domain protein 1-like [Centruroides vittatus]|uniref:cell growth regulator with RING finger domain protein 1-like n=1 Tax=Centruroides vittatus TaxID=120091 RepID=UPI003510A0CD
MVSSLVSVAEISNGLVVLVILCSLITMVSFLFRFRGDLYETSVKYVQNLRSAKPMVCVNNPFFIQFHDIQNLSLSDVSLNVSVQVKCLLQAFWGVTFDSYFLSLPWNILKETLINGDNLNISCISRSEVKHLDICQNFVIHLSPFEEISEHDLGEIPRIKYPLMVILVRESELSEDEDPNTVIGMISIMHIKDSICRMESRLIAQYLKQANGQTCSLKQLYMSSEMTYNTSNQCEVIDSSCVICQVLPVTRALLPCRHTCVCHRCFSRLDKCPICRSMIQSYFCIQNENYPIPSDEVELKHPLTISQRWENFNDRLNAWLGFT